MIIVKLFGGIGNQMFQYAFGRALSLKHQVELKLDISVLSDKTNKEISDRDFELEAFGIKATIASKEEIKKFSSGKMKKAIDLVSLSVPFKRDFFYLREPGFGFFRNALKAPANSYVDGYWQSEKYFMNIRPVLLKEFFPVNPLSEKSKKTVEKIKSVNAVSIHVRRGDYYSNMVNAKYTGICTEPYYMTAIEKISAKIKDPFFFIFSDEPDWFKKNIKMKFPVEYIEHNTGRQSYEDMFLMSLCRHNIIANSSFSWWGAWLNQNAEKNVIAPAKWFNDDSKKISDLLPSTWIKI